MTRNICFELGGNNIQCNDYVLGYIATPQTAPLLEKQNKKNDSQYLFDKFIISKIPAKLNAIFFVSDTSNFFNGNSLCW